MRSLDEVTLRKVGEVVNSIYPRVAWCHDYEDLVQEGYVLALEALRDGLDAEGIVNYVARTLGAITRRECRRAQFRIPIETSEGE